MLLADRIRSIIIGLIILFLPFWGKAQTLNLNQFGIEEGLPQSSIYTMLQDKEGSIWVGTMNGISKYNGLNFENYGKAQGLVEKRVTASAIDTAGNIWVGHKNGGISLYEKQKGRFKDMSPTDFYLSQTINAILCDSKGNVWFGTEGQGLFKYDGKKFYQYTGREGLADDEVHALMEDHLGRIWIGTMKGISILDNKFVTFPFTLASVKIKSLFRSSKDEYYVGTEDNGFYILDKQLKKSKHYSTRSGLCHNHVKVFYESDKGAIFIGTYGGGVSKFYSAGIGGYIKDHFQTISTQHGLSNDRVLSIIQDREKNIWIGTYLNLNQYFDEQFEIFGAKEGLHNSLIWSIMEDSHHNFWIGTEGGLVEFIPDINKLSDSYQRKFWSKHVKEKVHFIGVDGQLHEVPYRFIQYTGLNDEILNTTCLYEDVDGNIWYSDFGRGVSRLNPETGEIKHFDKTNGLPVNDIYAIKGDKLGNIWIGTNRGGLLRYDRKTGFFDRYTSQDGLGSDQIYAIHCDANNVVWLGTLAGPITYFNAGDIGKGKPQFKHLGEKEGYNSRFTVCIAEDAKGNKWFGTYEDGIYKFDGKTFRNYTTRDGLNTMSSYLLVCDNSNNLWIGNGLGIDKMHLETGDVKHYEKEDGFLGIEINPNATCKDTEGNIWFGSIIGLVKYNSGRENRNMIEPITRIFDPRIYFEKGEIPEDHAFSWGQNHLTFDFTGTSLTNPKRVKYRYMLEGLDGDWSPVMEENSVTYQSLPPGTYTFKVRSCNNDGVWNKEPVTYSFEILPPFWRRTWFYILCLVLLVFGIISFVQWREKALLEKNLLLEQKVEERTEMINKQKTEIEKKNTIITDSIEWAKNIQQSVLPTDKEMSAFLKQYFILYKPKDIVSGDFYWMFETDNRFYFIGADCTGHGVPGAFMSLMGNNFLNETMKDLNNPPCSEVLEILNNKVLYALRQDLDEASSKYGMDLAMIAIDKDTNRLEYSGAHNPLVIIRGTEIIEFKADKVSIGSKRAGDSRRFTNQYMDLQAGDCLYLFSDGYVDQKGGPEQKKFFARPFRELLRDISPKTPEEQHQILDKTMEEWKSGNTQTDDMLVVGIKIS